MSKELYNTEGKYNLFKDVNDKESLKKLLDGLDDNTVMAIKLPERLADYDEVLDKRKQVVVGIYDYEELRSSVLYDYGGDDSIFGILHSIDERLSDLDEAMGKLEALSAKIDEKYDKILKAMGHLKIDVSIKEYVGE